MANSTRSFAPEIQGLRAIAVISVVLFHLWPNVFPGGYVGVDVFFVISGYLITGLLGREIDRGGISLLRFYAGRVRRLIPAASVVLLTVWIAAYALLPPAQWGGVSTEVAASALYVQNWVLASQSIDYLAIGQAASPVQHYWSLSIEEQFYLIWPVVMILSGWGAKRLGISPRLASNALLLLIFVASLALSIRLTRNGTGAAYFFTHTRVWELALGGLLALNIHRVALAKKYAISAFSLGVSLIVLPVFALSETTLFPGWVALIPTVGSALVIAAGDIRVGRFSGLNNQALRYLGDRSYSIYLWHWPIIVFSVATIGPLDALASGAVILGTLLLSHLSYALVEQPFRYARTTNLRTIVAGSMAVAACAALPLLSFQAIVAAASTQYGPAPGPAVLLADAPTPLAVTFIPPLVSLTTDFPVTYNLGCHQTQLESAVLRCELGDITSADLLVLVGDSHAAQWIPALDAIASRNRMKLITLTKSACPFAGLVDNATCDEWQTLVHKEVLRLSPKLVIYSQAHYALSEAKVAIEARARWHEVDANNIKFLVIRDTPYLDFEPAQCLGTGRQCKTSSSVAMLSDPLASAAEADGRTVVEMTSGICLPDVCEAVVGGIAVWRDKHHITSTYSVALAPFLAPKIGLVAPN